MRLTKNRLYLLTRNAAIQLIKPGPFKAELFDDSKSFPYSDPVLLSWPDSIRRPMIGLVPDPHHRYPYWTKYRKFLEANSIPYVLYDIHRSDWAAAASSLDIIVWRPFSGPPELEECRRKIFVLESQMGKVCYPNFFTAMLYEDKVLQYELLTLHGLPVADTMVSHSYAEVMEKLPHIRFPIVAKLCTGSGSCGTELVASEGAARKLVKQVFSFAGRRTYWPYMNQKDYILFQRFIPGKPSDVRVIMMGDVAGGYIRDVPAGEFRASRMGTEWHGELPKEALSIAREVSKKLGLLSVAVDMLYDDERKQYFIIEISIFTEVETPTEVPARLNGVPGVYRFSPGSGDDDYRFEPAQFWLQEWVLREFLVRTWLEKEGVR
jgi:glutathione synthase/RimK-type ligase-like ATP-grasp enzyme